MKKLSLQHLLPLFLFFTLTTTIAQTPAKTDSLNLELDKNKEADELIQWLVIQRNIAAMQCKDLDCQVDYFKKTIPKIWRAPKDSLEYKSLANFYVYQGYIQYRTGRYNEAFETYESIFNDKKLATAQSPSYYHQYVHQNLGNIYTMRGEYEKAETSLNLFKNAASQPYQLGEVNNDLGKLFEKKKHMKKHYPFIKKV